MIQHFPTDSLAREHDINQINLIQGNNVVTQTAFHLILFFLIFILNDFCS